MTAPKFVTIEISSAGVEVAGAGLLTDRMARMMFGSILGGTETAEGWTCPFRHRPADALVLQISEFLSKRGWTVEAFGPAENYIRRARERENSFVRTKAAAARFFEGDRPISEIQFTESLERFGWRRDRRDLRAHQLHDALHALVAINSANFSVPGSGKTATTLSVIASHFMSDTIDLVIVIGPLSSFSPWEKETRAALDNKLRARRIRGTMGARREMYETTEPGDLLLISYASAAADKTSLVRLCNKFRVMLIVDESHRIKRFRGGLWAPAIRSIAAAARVSTILSGTPMPQSGRDLFSQLRVIWPDGDLTGPSDMFAANVERDFESVMTDIRPFITRTPKSALGLSPYYVQMHDVPMGPVQNEIYHMVKDNFVC